MLPIQTNLYIPVNEIFPEIKNDFATFKSLLGCLSRTDTLFWCARLNGVVSNTSGGNDINRQQYAPERFLSAKEIQAVNDFAQRNGGAQRVKVFFRGQLFLSLYGGSAFTAPIILGIEEPRTQRFDERLLRRHL